MTSPIRATLITLQAIRTVKVTVGKTNKMPEPMESMKMREVLLARGDTGRIVQESNEQIYM